MSSRVDTSRLAQTQYASPRGGGSAHVEAVGVRRDGLGGSGALRGGGDVGRGGVGQVVQTQTQGAGPQSYGTQESEEDMNALLEYMEQELAMLSGKACRLATLTWTQARTHTHSQTLLEYMGQELAMLSGKPSVLHWHVHTYTYTHTHCWRTWNKSRPCCQVRADLTCTYTHTHTHTHEHTAHTQKYEYARVQTLQGANESGLMQAA